MAVATIYTAYTGNWRGVVDINSVIEGSTGVTFNYSLRIGRKGTGTLNTQTYYWRVGATSSSSEYGSGSRSLSKSGWTNSGQERDLVTNVSQVIAKTYSEQTINIHFRFRYGSSGNWYETTKAYQIEVPPLPTPDYPTMQTKVNGAWKSAVVHTKVNGAWKTVTGIYTKVNGAWKSVSS